MADNFSDVLIVDVAPGDETASVDRVRRLVLWLAAEVQRRAVARFSAPPGHRDPFVVLVVDGWEEAYNGAFSGGGASEGTRPLVVSYASSPPAEVLYADLDGDYAFDETTEKRQPYGLAAAITRTSSDAEGRVVVEKA